MIKSVIISGDAEAAALALQAITDFCPNVSISGDAEAVQAGVALVNSAQPDLVILDTRLKDGSGFEFLKHFEQPPFRIIFISTHIEYALKAFKFDAVDFILKPPDPNELARTYFEAGKCLREPGAGKGSLMGISGGECLLRARSMFEEMELKEDLAELERYLEG